MSVNPRLTAKTTTIDENNNLTQVSYEDNSKYAFTYFDGSLMNIMTDPNGNNIQHVWNANGRIVEVDGLNGFYQFLRNVNGDGTFYSTMILATGESVIATFASDEKLNV